MHLRTPKRYQKQRRHLFSSLRWLWLWILTPIVAIGGWQIYENRDEFGPPVRAFFDNMAQDASAGIATVTAPTPLPTENPEGQLSVAYGAWQQGSIDEAVRIYQSVLSNVPNDVDVHFRVTLGLIMQGKAEEALKAADATVNANPYSSDAWAIRAAALNLNRRQGEAIANALQALAFNPDNTRAKAYLAQAYFNANQIERAKTTVEAALDTDPDNIEALYVYGQINQYSTYDFRAAMQAYDRAYDIAPNMHHIGVSKAWLHYNLQEADQGFEILQDIAELNPSNSEALYALAFLSQSVYGTPNQALDYLTQCLAANPESISCNYYTGTVQFGLGNNEAAAQAFMKVIEIGTTNPRHYLSAGRINATLNNCRAAIPLLQEGYRMEQQAASSSQEQLTAFEEALRGCNATTAPQNIEPVQQEPAPDTTESTLDSETGFSS